VALFMALGVIGQMVSTYKNTGGLATMSVDFGGGKDKAPVGFRGSCRRACKKCKR